MANRKEQSSVPDGKGAPFSFDPDSGGAGLKAKTISGLLITGGGQALRMAITLGGSIALARLLEPDDFGIIKMVVAATAFVAVFRDGGLSTATIQKDKTDHHEVSTLFWVNVVLGVVLMVVTCAAAPLIAWYYADNDLVPLVIALSSSFLISALGVQHTAILRRKMRFGQLALIDIVSLSASMIIAVLLALGGAGYWSLVAMNLTAPFVAALMPWMMLSWKPSKPVSLSKVKKSLSFGGGVSVHGFLGTVGANIDTLVIGRMFGTQTTGFYDRAYQLLMMPLQRILPVLTSVGLPAFSRLANQPEKFARSLIQALVLIGLGASFLAGILYVTSDWVILTLYGPKWEEAIPIFQMFAITVFTMPTGTFANMVITSLGKSALLVSWGVVNTVVIAIAVFVGVQWGPVGVAACISLSSLLIRYPTVCWFMARAGAAPAMTIYKTVFAMFALYGASAGLLLWVRSAFLEDVAPVWGIVSIGLISVAVHLAVLLLHRRTRPLVFKGLSLVRQRIAR